MPYLVPWNKNHGHLHAHINPTPHIWSCLSPYASYPNNYTVIRLYQFWNIILSLCLHWNINSPLYILLLLLIFHINIWIRNLIICRLLIWIRRAYLIYITTDKVFWWVGGGGGGSKTETTSKNKLTCWRREGCAVLNFIIPRETLG